MSGLRDRIESIGGELSIRSAPDVGTRIKASLPLEDRMPPKIRIGVVDDHSLYRDGVVFALEYGTDIEVVAQGETAADAIQIAHDHAPDVLLLDMNMPGGGIKAVSKIALKYPSTKTLMLTVVDDEDEVRSALRKGARGYLLKGTSSSELVNAVRLVNKGQNYVSPSFAAKLIVSRREEADLPTRRAGFLSCP